MGGLFSQWKLPRTDWVTAFERHRCLFLFTLATQGKLELEIALWDEKDECDECVNSYSKHVPGVLDAAVSLSFLLHTTLRK